MKARQIKRLASVGAVLLLALLFYFHSWETLEYRAQDALYQKPGIINPEIVVFGIDEAALAMFGPYNQWSRSVMAEAIAILNTYEDEKPAVIAVDIMYTEPGRDQEADDALVRACAEGGNVVMAASVSVGYDYENLSLNLVITDYVKPFPDLEPYVHYGLINSATDPDGVIRQALLRQTFKGERLYSFPVEIARQYTGHIVPFAQENSGAYINFTGLPGDFMISSNIAVSVTSLYGINMST
jgi:adenylate cyclase